MPLSVDEDVFAFLEAWLKRLHPRRGGARPPVKLDKKAPAATDALVVAARARWMDESLLHRINPHEVVDEIRRTLEGDASPLGAAALALAVAPGHKDELAPFVDAWTQRHGFAFAALAAVEIGHLETWQADVADAVLDRSKGPGHLTRARLDLLRRMRALLVTCSENEYASAVTELAAVRDCCERCRLASAYLAPTEVAWVTHACHDYNLASRQQGETQALLHCSLSTAEHIGILGDEAQLSTFGTGLDTCVTMIDGLGPDAAALFSKCLDGNAYPGAKTVREIGSIVAQLPGDVPLRALIDRLGEPNLSAAVQEAVSRFPRRALRILAEAAAPAPAGRRNTEAAREALRRHVRTHRDLAQTAVDELPEAAAAFVRTLLSQIPATRPTAAAHEVPPYLAAPPWRREAGPKAAESEHRPKVVTGLTAGPLPRVVWAEQDAIKTADQTPAHVRRDFATMATEVASRMEVGALDDWGDRYALELFSCGPVEPNRELMSRWRPKFDWQVEDQLWPILFRFEADAVPALVHNARNAGPREAGTLLLPVLDIEAARLMADWFVRLKTGRAPAIAWFDRHGADAATLLIPDAVGTPGKARAAAGAALRHLAGTLPGLVELAGTEYGADAAEAVRAILAGDPGAPPPPMPPLPDWLVLPALPQVLLRGGQAALPDEATRTLLEAFALTAAQDPVRGLAENLRTTLDALDLAAVAGFCWEVFEAWRTATHPPKQAWTLSVLGLVGDDRAAVRLTPLIKAWPGESGHHRAVAGLDVLAGIGTDQALQLLNDVALRAQFKALKDAAVAKVAQVAMQRGLTGEQLADRLVPDLGLDADGGLWLDYGPRRFRVGFDEELKPFVTDEAGRHRRDLPSPNAKDDAELAAAARAGFTALKKQARTVAGTEIRRLEAALVEQRGWAAEEFSTLLLAHPLLRHVVRRLLWVAQVDAGTGQEREGFRVAEDGTLANLADEAYTLPSDAIVRLAHPLTWPQGLAAWGEVFADYEILQPFQQLDRPVYEPTDEERGSHRLARFEGRTVQTGRLLGLTGQGWRRSPAQDNGIENCITKRLGDGLYLVIDLDDGIQVGAAAADRAVEQTLEAVYLSDRAEVYHQGRRKDSGMRFADLDPLTASELLGQLTRLVD
jgi:hypothetical protein